MPSGPAKQGQQHTRAADCNTEWEPMKEQGKDFEDVLLIKDA